MADLPLIDTSQLQDVRPLNTNTLSTINKSKLLEIIIKNKEN